MCLYVFKWYFLCVAHLQLDVNTPSSMTCSMSRKEVAEHIRALPHVCLHGDATSPSSREMEEPV